MRGINDDSRWVRIGSWWTLGFVVLLASAFAVAYFTHPAAPTKLLLECTAPAPATSAPAAPNQPAPKPGQAGSQDCPYVQFLADQNQRATSDLHMTEQIRSGKIAQWEKQLGAFKTPYEYGSFPKRKITQAASLEWASKYSWGAGLQEKTLAADNQNELVLGPVADVLYGPQGSDPVVRAHVAKLLRDEEVAPEEKQTFNKKIEDFDKQTSSLLWKKFTPKPALWYTQLKSGGSWLLFVLVSVLGFINIPVIWLCAVTLVFGILGWKTDSGRKLFGRTLGVVAITIGGLAICSLALLLFTKLSVWLPTVTDAFGPGKWIVSLVSMVFLGSALFGWLCMTVGRIPTIMRHFTYMFTS